MQNGGKKRVPSFMKKKRLKSNGNVSCFMVNKYKMQMSPEASKLLTIMTSISWAFTMYQAHPKNLECICLFKMGYGLGLCPVLREKGSPESWTFRHSHLHFTPCCKSGNAWGPSWVRARGPPLILDWISVFPQTWFGRWSQTDQLVLPSHSSSPNLAA